MTKRWLCALIAGVCLLTACAEAPTVTIEDAVTVTTVPTVAVPEGQLTITKLLSLTGRRLTWSGIAAYNHTATDDTHAVFTVADTYGRDCTLTVTYDAATDAVSEATLSYGDTAVDITEGRTEDIRTVIMAMNG